MPGEARRILIAGYYGFGNAGDEAILAALIAGLRSLRPDLDLTVASGDPAATASAHGVHGIDRQDLPAVAAAIRESDLVILGGGGLFQDYWDVPLDAIFTPRSGGLPFYAGFSLLAAWLGRPVLLCAVGVGPLRTETGRRLTRIAFELCAGATVRDAASLAELAELGVATAAEVTADPAFALAPAIGRVSGKGVPTVETPHGVNPGGRLYSGTMIGVSLRPWSFGADQEIWESEVARGLDQVLAAGDAGDSGEHLLLLPFQADEDLPVLRRVHDRLANPDRALLIDQPLAPAELAGLVGRCTKVLAMRYHAALFALAADVPVAALAYDPKVASLLTAAGLGDLALPPEQWREEAVAATLLGARRPLAGFGADMRRRAAKNAVRAIEILGKKREGERPAPAEGPHLLGELAADKAIAAFRLEIESADRAARIETLREEVAARAAEIERLQETLKAEQESARTDQESARADRESARADQARDGETIQALERDRTGLREQRDLILTERNDLDRRLTAFERTLAYRIVSRFWGLMRRLFPEGSQRRKIYRLGRRAVGKLLGASDPAGFGGSDAPWREGMGGAPSPGSSLAPAEGPAPDPRADLLAFEERVHERGAGTVVALFSATQLLESEGQRPTQLALALARRGVPVVFVYWRWWDTEWRPQDRLEDGIVQIPIDVVTRRPEMLTAAFEGRERIALFEFPHPGFFETLSAANSAGWITVYDVLDDWEEFHRVGQAIWYDEEYERHQIGACDAVYAINSFLTGRIRELGGDAVEVVGNGLKPGLEVVREPRPLERGEVTVGYFGYLAGAWFDWELIADAARLRPAWRFYLIGYGGSPEGVTLPGTVILLGKQPQTDLAAFAANWDVAVIPFKPDRLAAGADPIKTYEYLAMGLPVVVTGVYAPEGGEGLVARAEGTESFVQEIERAAVRRGMEEIAARRAFAATCTWDHRIEELLESLGEGRQRVAEKRALLGGRP
jgi:polysaccharide pyruvyl transferase CsaB